MKNNERIDVILEEIEKLKERVYELEHPEKDKTRSGYFVNFNR